MTSCEACLAPYIGQNANSTLADRMYHGLKIVSQSHVYPCETRTLPCRPLERQSARLVRKPPVLDCTMIACSISVVFSGLGTRAPAGSVEIDNFDATSANRRRPCRLADRRKCVVHRETATASCKIIRLIVVPKENRSGARQRRPGVDMWRNM